MTNPSKVESTSEWEDWEVKEIVASFQNMLQWELDNPIPPDDRHYEYLQGKREDTISRLREELAKWDHPETYPPKPVA